VIKELKDAIYPKELSMDSRGQALGTSGSIIAVVLTGLIAFLVTVQLISGTALASNSIVALITTTLIPVGLMAGVARQLGLI
jgi:hypothetical protein